MAAASEERLELDAAIGLEGVAVPDVLVLTAELLVVVVVVLKMFAATARLTPGESMTMPA